MCVEGMMRDVDEVEKFGFYVVSCLYGILCNDTLQRCCQDGFSMLGAYLVWLLYFPLRCHRKYDFEHFFRYHP